MTSAPKASSITHSAVNGGGSAPEFPARNSKPRACASRTNADATMTAHDRNRDARSATRESVFDFIRGDQYCRACCPADVSSRLQNCDGRVFRIDLRANQAPPDDEKQAWRRKSGCCM